LRPRVYALLSCAQNTAELRYVATLVLAHLIIQLLLDLSVACHLETCSLAGLVTVVLDESSSDFGRKAALLAIVDSLPALEVMSVSSCMRV